MLGVGCILGINEKIDYLYIRVLCYLFVLICRFLFVHFLFNTRIYVFYILTHPFSLYSSILTTHTH